MPIYCYKTDDGEVVEQIFPMGRAPDQVTTEGGEIARRDIASEHLPRRAGAGWPMECVASGVSGGQAKELRALYKKHGFRCDVTANGNPVYESPSHRKKALKLRGFFDQDSYS